jgi:DNA (cytosine-5)-methyltransferase 1
MQNNQFKFIDLFAGIGGFRLALEESGGDCVYTSEWDEKACVTYKANFKGIVDGDITKVNEKNIPAHDVLCAGFPCQAFSISGKQKGFEDTRGTLFFDVARIVKYHKPKVLFLENVKNFARHDDGKTLQVILNTLDQIGYDVFYRILNASQHGAITSRERIYLIAFRKDLEVSNFEFPIPQESSVFIKDILEKKVDLKYFINRPDIYLKVEKLVPLFQTSLPRPIQVGKINKGGQGERIYSINGHAITLSANGGGAAAKTGAYLIDNKIRKLTPRECARVMGFPESFVIPVTDQQAYKQFGNSVAIPVLKSIFKEIIKTNILWKKNTDIHLNSVQILQKGDFVMNKMS